MQYYNKSNGKSALKPTMRNDLKIIITLISILLLVINTSFLEAKSNSAVIPLNISVQGKLIISDAESDGHDNSNILNTSLNTKIRIRTNLNRWQLVATRNNEIENNKILISYKLSAARKANLKSAKLNSNFSNPTLSNNIPRNSQITILEGLSKTSLERDSGNHNNYLELSQDLNSIDNSEVSESDIANTSITYSLVSL